MSEMDKERINFADHTFKNIQELIRFLDQKCTFNILLTGVLCAIICGPVLEEFKKISINPRTNFNYTLMIIFLVYVIFAFRTFWYSTMSTIARPNMLGNHCGAKSMIFPLMILKEFNKSDAKYLETLKELSSEQILAEYSQQILEISNIYSIKQAYSNKSSNALVLSVSSGLFVAISLIVPLFKISFHADAIILSAAVITTTIIWRLFKNRG